jgi:tetratricopeptide (TPR) repeat protein
MFAGSAPFTGSSPMQVLTKQLTEAPPPLGLVRPDLPPEITATIDRALSKLPTDRWGSAEEFARALEGATPASPMAAAPRTTSATVVSQPVAIAPARRWPSAGLASAAVVVLAVTAGLLTWMRASGAPTGVDPRKSFFVAPFEILGGGEQLAWLREGSASMLTLNLAQWSDLNVVSYERGLDLLREARLDTARRIGLAEARAMARKAGVWTVVMGQVTAAGDSVLVTARLFDVASGRQLHQAQQNGSRTADPRPLFDGLTRQLLDVAGAPSTISLGRLSETTTESIEAYRAYLEGTRAMNRWQLDRADSLFALATARDSDFALAYYHRAMVLGWRQVGDSLHLALAARAAALGSKLPPRERELVAGYADLTTALQSEIRGDTLTSQAKYPSAQAHYAAPVARDSGDAESWYGLADAYWHHRIDGWGKPRTVGNWNTALRAFDRTLALDSTFYLAYAHKIDLYRQAAGQTPLLMLDGDSLRLLDPAAVQRSDEAERFRVAQRRAYELAVRDARAWIAAAPSSNAYQSLALLYFTRGHADSAADVLRQALAHRETHDAHTPFQLVYAESKSDPLVALRSLRQALRAPRRARSGAARLEQPDRVPVRGGRRGCDDGQPDGRRFGRLAGRAHRGGTGGARLARGSTRAPLAARRAARRGGPHAHGRTRARGGTRQFRAVAQGARRFLRTQAIASLYVSYLATRDARSLALLRAWRYGQAPLSEIDALAALDVRDTVAARAAMKLFPSADSVRTANAPVSLPRWIARARAYEAVGDLRGALAAYSVLEPKQISPLGQADPSWPFYARSLLWRGALHERLGERAAAIDSYRRFVTLWAEADPALQPQRDSARAALRRLGVTT